MGRRFGYVMIFLGAVELMTGGAAGAWLAMVGFFVVMAAGAQAAGARVQAAVSGVPARELMSSPVVAIPGGVEVRQAARDYFVRYRYTAFPVLDERGRALGLITLQGMQALVDRDADMERTLAEVADRDPGLIAREGRMWRSCSSAPPSAGWAGLSSSTRLADRSGWSR